MGASVNASTAQRIVTGAYVVGGAGGFANGFSAANNDLRNTPAAAKRSPLGGAAMFGIGSHAGTGVVAAATIAGE